MKTEHRHQKDPHKYDDIMYLPRPVSRRPKMDVMNRAAQFAPFAALNGYEEVIEETKRFTDDKKELDDNEKMLLDQKLQRIMEQTDDRPQIQITYFVPDEKKSGGVYQSICGVMKRVNFPARSIVMEDGTVIQMDAVTDIAIISDEKR